MALRLLFRLLKTIILACLVLMMLVPRKKCTRRHSGEDHGGNSWSAGARCIKYELRSLYCPFYQFPTSSMSTTAKPESADMIDDDYVREDACSAEFAVEILWTSLVCVLLLFAYLLDLAFGRRFLAKFLKWNATKRTKFYRIMLIVTSVAWMSIIIAMSIALGWRWERAIGEQEYDIIDGKPVPDLSAIGPPKSWVFMLNFAVFMICVNGIEIATIHFHPENYLTSDEEKKADEMKQQSRKNRKNCQAISPL